MQNEDGKVVIQIVGENSQLASALKASENQVRNFTNQLSLIDNALQFNPGNVELLNQKFRALTGEINATQEKLNQLKSAEQQVENKFASGQIGTAEYEAFRREILNTEAALRNLVNTQNSMIDESGNLRDVTDEMDNLGNSIDNAGQSTVTFGDLLKANILSDYIRQGINKLAGAFGDFVKQGVELASDLTEVQNVVDTTFGDGAAEIYEWADAAAESFGMSSLSAQQYTGTLGAMLKSSGVADESIVKMSEDLVGLAGDMASFYNLDVETAFEKIRSGISGETEPLKQLGINMSVANLEAYALANGIETAYDKMSQSEQTLLRYNYLMSQTADAQGDFAKTSDSYANQQRILQLQIENLSAALGEKLLPHLNDVVTTVNDKLPEAEGIIENIGEILGNVTGFALDHYEAIIGLVAAYGTFHGVLKAGNTIGTYVTSLKGLTTATQAATTAQQGMNAAAAVNPYALIAAGAAALIVILVSLASSIDGVSTSLKETAEESVSAYEEQKEKVSELEAELEDVDEQIRQIQSRGKLNFTDEKELTNLQLQSEELRTQIALEKELLELKNKQVSEDAIKAIMSENSTSEGSIAAVRTAIDEYKEAESGLKYWQDELNKAISEGNEKAIYEANENIDQYTSAINNAKIWLLEAQEAVDGLAENLDTSAEDGQAAAEAVNSLRNEVAGLLDITTKDYLDGFYANGTALDATGERYKKEYTAAQEAAEDTEAARAAREKDLADYVAYLDTKLKLRQTSEDQYFSDLKNYLDIHQDTESEAWFDQLEKYEKYQQDKIDADKKAAEEAQKNAEKDAEEKQTQYEKSVEDYVDTLKTKLELDDEYTEDMYYDDLEKLVETLDEGSELYKKNNDEVLKGRKKLSDELADEIEDSKNEITEKYQKLFDDLETKRENYRKKLLSVGGDIFSVETEKDENGNETTTYTINNIDEQIKKMREYNAAVKKLKKQDASESLLEELTSMNSEDSANFAKYLSGMSEEEFAKINALYEEKQKVADELSQELYAEDAQKISDSMDAELEALTDRSTDYGKTAAENFANAFTSEIKNALQNANFASEIKTTVEIEQSRYSAAAHTAPAAPGSTENTAEVSGKNSEINKILSELNKPIQIVLDGKIIAEAVLNYQQKHNQQTGG